MERLTDDVLVEIFKYNIKKIVTKTHVCRQWRNIALGYTLFWSEIDVGHNRDRLETFLLRSQSRPISILATLCTSRNLTHCGICFDNTIIALRHVSRTRTLKIMALDRYFSDKDRESIRDALEKPMPLLQTLELNFCRCGQYFHLPDFSRDLGNLRNVYLTDVALPWTPSIFQNLTRLSIRASDAFRLKLNNVFLVIEPVELLDILRASPRLEVLYINAFDLLVQLCGSRRIGDFPSLPHPDVIEMPSLTSITLDGIGKENCRKLLQYIQASPNAHIHITVSFSPLEDSALSMQIKDIVTPTLTVTPDVPQRYQSAELALTDNSISITFSKLILDGSNVNFKDKFTGRVTFTTMLVIAHIPYVSGTIFIPEIDKIVAQYLKAVNDMEYIVIVGILDKTCILRFEWERVFQALPFVQFFSLGFALPSVGDNTNKFYFEPLMRKEVAMMLFDTLSGDDPNRITIFPQLSHFQIWCNEKYLGNVPHIYDIMFECFKLRKEKGAPHLQSVKLLGPGRTMQSIRGSYDLLSIAKNEEIIDIYNASRKTIMK